MQGRQSLAGLKAWADDTNRNGGIWVSDMSARLPVRLINYDDESGPGRCEELTERLNEAQEEILMDDMTQVYNRRAFDGRIKESVKRRKMFEKNFGLIMFDIDPFQKCKRYPWSSGWRSGIDSVRPTGKVGFPN